MRHTCYDKRDGRVQHSLHKCHRIRLGVPVSVCGCKHERDVL
jgi:hypothetical protein